MICALDGRFDRHRGKAVETAGMLDVSMTDDDSSLTATKVQLWPVETAGMLDVSMTDDDSSPFAIEVEHVCLGECSGVERPGCTG